MPLLTVSLVPDAQTPGPGAETHEETPQTREAVGGSGRHSDAGGGWVRTLAGGGFRTLVRG